MVSKEEIKALRADIERMQLKLFEAGAEVSVACPSPAVIDAMLAKGVVMLTYSGEHQCEEIWATADPDMLKHPEILGIEELDDAINGVNEPSIQDMFNEADWPVTIKPEEAFKFFRFGGYDDNYGAEGMAPGWAWLPYGDVGLIETAGIDAVTELYC